MNKWHRLMLFISHIICLSIAALILFACSTKIEVKKEKAPPATGSAFPRPGHWEGEKKESAEASVSFDLSDSGQLTNFILTASIGTPISSCEISIEQAQLEVDTESRTFVLSYLMDYKELEKQPGAGVMSLGVIPKGEPYEVLHIEGTATETMLTGTYTIRVCGSSLYVQPQTGEWNPQWISAVNTQTSPSTGTLSTEVTELIPTTEITQALEWQSNWLHFGVDDQFSSYQPEETLITRENIADLQQISGAGCDDDYFSVIAGTPSIYQGQMILTYAGGNMEVGNPLTDEKIWDFGPRANAWAPPPVVSADGIVYYLSVTSDASAKLFAVDLETRQQVWEAATQFETGFNFDAQVTVDEDSGMIYVIEGYFGDGRLFGVDRATGEVNWFKGVEQHDEGVTFVGSHVPSKDNKLYIPAGIPEGYSKRFRMVRVDVVNQEIDLQYDVPAELNFGWHVEWYGLCNDYVFETYSSNHQATVLAAHQSDQAKIIWQLEIPPQSGRFSCDTQQGILYVPTDTGLIALDAGTGEKIWEHKSLSSVFTPTIANGIIYYLSETNMYALDQVDGHQLFHFPLGVKANPSTGVAVNDGLVIFSGSGGTCDLFVLGFK